MEDWGDRKCRSFTTEIVKLKLVFILAPEPGRKMVWLMKDTAWLLVTLGSFPKFTWVTNGRCPTLPRFNQVYHPKVFQSIICCSLDNTKQNILERTEIIGNTYGEKKWKQGLNFRYLGTNILFLSVWGTEAWTLLGLSALERGTGFSSVLYECAFLSKASRTETAALLHKGAHY